MQHVHGLQVDGVVQLEVDHQCDGAADAVALVRLRPTHERPAHSGRVYTRRVRPGGLRGVCQRRQQEDNKGQRHACSKGTCAASFAGVPYVQDVQPRNPLRGTVVLPPDGLIS